MLKNPKGSADHSIFANMSGAAASNTTMFSRMTGFSNATGDSSGAILQNINQLQQMKTDYNAQITAKQQELTATQAARGGCKRTIGWNNGCLSDNTAKQNQLKSDIANLQQRIVDLDTQIATATQQYETTRKAELDAAARAAELERQRLASEAAAEAQRKAAEAERLKAEAERLKAEASSRPETASLQAQTQQAQIAANQAAQLAQIQADAAAKAAQTETQADSKMLYIGAGVVVFIVLVVATMFILKK